MKLSIRATPNAWQSEIVGWEDDPQHGKILRVRIAAPPVDGQANLALRGFLAESFKLPKSRVTVERGSSSRFKTIDLPDGTLLP